MEWIVSFADGTQCGDGTIYRASGFLLTGVKTNATLMRFPDGEVIADLSIQAHLAGKGGKAPGILAKKYGVKMKGGSTVKDFLKIGAEYIPGYQLRYIYFLNPQARERLTVPVLPFSRIDELGAGMYRGKPKETPKRPKQAESGPPEMRQCDTDPDAPIPASSTDPSALHPG
jgi:hypothetical protein